MHRLLSTALLTIALICSHPACSSTSKAQDVKITYPATRTVEQIDDFHGTKVADPYRWLEDDVRVSKESAAWVEAQNAVTFDYLKSIPQRETIRQRMTELWNYEKVGAPFQIGRAHV